MRLRLSASEGLGAGQVIDFIITGRALQPGVTVDLKQCDADARLKVGGDTEDLGRRCTQVSTHTVEAASVEGQFAVEETFVTQPTAPELPEVVHCGDERRDCTMVAVIVDRPGHIEALDIVRIEVVPSPIVVGGPGLLGDGTVQVWISGEPRTTVTLAQCVRYPGVTRDLDRCRVGPTVMLSRTGQAGTEMTVVPTLEVDGRTFDCFRRPCQVTLFDSSGAILLAADIPGSVPHAEIALDRSTGLRHGDVVRARIASAAGSSHYIGLCLASVADDVIPTGDGCFAYSPLAGPGLYRSPR